MHRLPKIVASSVVRSTHKGESHGGVYIVDLDEGSSEQKIDWDSVNISWEGRGSDRGLRGIAFHGENVYLAASNEIFVFDRNLQQIASFANKYLNQVHEICVKDGSLFISSTGFDSLLELDLETETFVRGYCFREFEQTGNVFESDPVSRSLISARAPSPRDESGAGVARLYNGLRSRVKRGLDGMLGGDAQTALADASEEATLAEPELAIRPFDPTSDDGPVPADTLHINNVVSDAERIYFSGTGIGWLYAIEGGAIEKYAKTPHGTHNVRPFAGGTLMHDTAADRITRRSLDGEIVRAFEIVRYDESALLMSNLPKDYCRQAFGRGLAVTPDGLIIAGSSPATISVYEPDNPKPIASVNITMDVRNAIHGLEIWPF